MVYLRTRWRRSGMTPKTAPFHKTRLFATRSVRSPRHPGHRNDEGHRGVVAVWTGSTGTLVFGAIDFACRSLRLFQMRGIIRVSEARRLSLPIRTRRPTDTPPTGTSRRMCTNDLGAFPRRPRRAWRAGLRIPPAQAGGPRHRRGCGLNPARTARPTSSTI